MDSIINKIMTTFHDFSVSDQAFARCHKAQFHTDLIKLILNIGAGSWLNFHAFSDINSRMTASNTYETTKG